MTLAYAFAGAFIAALVLCAAMVLKHKPTRFLVVLLALSVATSACATRRKAETVKTALTVEQTLGTFREALGRVCNPGVSFPASLKTCTAQSAAKGLTSAKFLAASASLAAASKTLADSLIPAIRCAPANLNPAPECIGVPALKVAYTAFYGSVSDAVTVARTVKDDGVTTAIQTVTDALGALGARVVRIPN